MKNMNTLKDMRKSAKITVAGAAAAAAASCTIPIPVADTFILIGEQIAMMGAIGTIYNLSFEKKTLQLLVFGALGTNGAAFIGKSIVGNAFKCIPVIGSAIGGAISASTAGVLTFALGNAFIELCEAVKKEALSEEDITKGTGRDTFLKILKQNLKSEKRKNKHSHNKDSSSDNLQDNTDILLSKITISKIDQMEKYDNAFIIIRYDNEPICSIILKMKEYRGNEKKAVLLGADMEKAYRGKHIFSYAIRQIAQMCPVEIPLKKVLPEYKDMVNHLLTFDNVLAG